MKCQNRMRAIAALVAATGFAGVAKGVVVYEISTATGTTTFTPVAVTFQLSDPTADVQICTTPGGLSTSFNLGTDHFDAPERVLGDDVQPELVRSAVAVLPPAEGYAVVFSYDVSTWDSYTDLRCNGILPVGLASAGRSGRVGSGSPGVASPAMVMNDYWDLFTVNVNQSGSYDLLVTGGPLNDPIIQPDPDDLPIIANPSSLLPGETWAFGGLCWGDENLVTVQGRQVLTFTGTPGSPYVLSITLDTQTVDLTQGNPDDDSTDVFFPSWGTISDSTDCGADWNFDGFIDSFDVTDFLNAVTAGDITTDLSLDGVIGFQDVITFLNQFNDGDCDSCPLN